MSHYFEAPTGQARQRSITATIWGRHYQFTTANGVFSGARLDPGTAVLFAETTPPATAQRVADVGCGYGPIAVALATHCPQAHVDAVDVNPRALELTATNADQAGVGHRVRPLSPGQVDQSARYDQIWSNPPIRIGKQALHDLLLEWLPRLATDGQAWLVVGKNLGADSLQRWLIEQGYRCERWASSKGFRVLLVTHSTPGGEGNS